MTGKTLILMAMMASTAAASSGCILCGGECPQACWDAFKEQCTVANNCDVVNRGYWNIFNSLTACAGIRGVINGVNDGTGNSAAYAAAWGAVNDAMRAYADQIKQNITSPSPPEGLADDEWLLYGLKQRETQYCKAAACAAHDFSRAISDGEPPATETFCGKKAASTVDWNAKCALWTGTPNKVCAACSDLNQYACDQVGTACGGWVQQQSNAQGTCVSDGGSMTDTKCAGQTTAWKCGHSKHGYADCKWHREPAHCADATQLSQTNLVQQESDKKKPPVDDLISLLDDASRAGVQDFTCW